MCLHLSLRDAINFSSVITERIARVVNTPASYSGGPRFNSRSGNRLSRLRFSWFSSVPPGKCWQCHNLGHDRFFPNPLQFIIHLSSLHSTLCNLLRKASLNKRQSSILLDRLSDSYWWCRWCSSGFWRRLDLYVGTSVTEEHTVHRTQVDPCGV
jgi:hypothetical protein